MKILNRPSNMLFKDANTHLYLYIEYDNSYHLLIHFNLNKIISPAPEIKIIGK